MFSAEVGGRRVGNQSESHRQILSQKTNNESNKKVSLFEYLCYKNEYKSVNPTYVLENCLLWILKKANIRTSKTETNHIPTKGKIEIKYRLTFKNVSH